MREDFACLILSHGRADNVKTIKTLKKCGYNGKWYIVIDNEDNQIEDYKKNYGADKIIVFNKEKARERCDLMDNFTGKGTPLFARNTFHIIAKYLKLTYFLELDDDYDIFGFRYDDNGVFRQKRVTNIEKIFDLYIDFLENTNAKTVCFAQMGDFIGGMGSNVWKNKITRKAMNAFFCKTDRPFKFIGRFNDDVNSYIEGGKKGDLYFTLRDIALNQAQTQANAGGITEAYLQYGTYVKSFYSVILNPSFVTIKELGTSHRRLHHLISWENCCPKIISSRYKK